MTAILPAKKIDRDAAMMHDECPCQLVYTFCVKLQGKCPILNRDLLGVAARCVCFGKTSKMCVSTKGVRSTDRWRKPKHRRPFRPRVSTSKNLIKLRTDIKRSAPETTVNTLDNVPISPKRTCTCSAQRDCMFVHSPEVARRDSRSVSRNRPAVVRRLL